MKKSVILLIGIIYILAIVIVGFLGLKMRVYDEEKYVEEIICISDYYQTNNNKTPKNDYDGFILNDYGKGSKVEIKCQVKPDNATNKKLEYVWQQDSTVYNLTVNSDGTAVVEFLSNGTATITVRATDSTHTQLKIKIYAYGDI